MRAALLAAQMAIHGRRNVPTRRWLAAVMLSLLALLLTFWAPLARPAEATAAPTRLVTAKQLRQELKKLRGQVVVVNFWATWCTPCLREIPDLVVLESELQPRGLKLLGVSMNEPAELASQVEPFRLKYFPKFTTLLRNEPDMDGMASVIDPAWNEILPTTWLLGRDGKVVAKIQGRKSRDELRALFAAALK